MTAPKHSPAPWRYEYSPYRVQRKPDGIESELPAFEVFDDDGNKVFDTNEDTSCELQEANARMASTAPRLLASLLACAELLADYDEADGQEGEAYREALRIDPKRAGLWYYLGVAYRKLGNQPNEIEAYQKALEIDPKYANAWNNLGAVYGGTGQQDKAIDAFREALRNDPQHADAWTNLGSAYALLGEYGKAIDTLREALRIEPKNASRTISTEAGISIYAKQEPKPKFPPPS